MRRSVWFKSLSRKQSGGQKPDPCRDTISQSSGRPPKKQSQIHVVTRTQSDRAVGNSGRQSGRPSGRQSGRQTQIHVDKTSQSSGRHSGRKSGRQSGRQSQMHGAPVNYSNVVAKIIHFYWHRTAWSRGRPPKKLIQIHVVTRSHSAEGDKVGD